MSVQAQNFSGPGAAAEQPYRYRKIELVEPDWRRFPGWRDVTAEQ